MSEEETLKEIERLEHNADVAWSHGAYALSESMAEKAAQLRGHLTDGGLAKIECNGIAAIGK